MMKCISPQSQYLTNKMMFQRFCQILVIMSDSNTGNDKTPSMLTINKAHITKGSLVILIPFVLRFNIVTI